MTLTLDVEEIRSLLPHRFPMLLVDRILALEPGKRVVGLKNVTINEPFFTGHFPQLAVMPGVLLIEAMAQVAGVMLLSLPDHSDKLAYIAEVQRMRFRRPVVPGDTLITEANLRWFRRDMGMVELAAHVGDVLVAEGELKFALQPPMPAPDFRARSGSFVGMSETADDQLDHRIARQLAYQGAAGATVPGSMGNGDLD